MDDVGLGPLADNGGPTLTRLPAPGSPLLDRAVGTCGPADQRGLPRPQGPACDTGAVERPLGGFHPMPPTRVLDSRDGTGGWTTPLGAGETRPHHRRAPGRHRRGRRQHHRHRHHRRLAPVHRPDPATIAGVSTLNWRTGQTVANSTTIPVGPGDTIAVRNNTGTTQVSSMSSAPTTTATSAAPAATAPP
ncbi:MAG: choice-of-anchor Q domain-containing protein [Acidimicrobiales bacterium]